MPLPDRRAQTGTATKQKIVVVLQGPLDVGWASQTDVSVVVASTNRAAPSAAPASYEVWVGTSDGFKHDTIIDCRWPYTVFKSTLKAGWQITTLGPGRMEEINLALVAGLQMA
jgi:mRNA-degrading endonuclease toxin of MazEF toxin-antitoxin module